MVNKEPEIIIKESVDAIADYKPVIIVVAYNRADSLKRLLGSVANMKSDHDVKLIISIDYSKDQDIVAHEATKFAWEKGEIEIIKHSKNLGLRQHILECGDLSRKYGSVIILEDDLFVSPYFYQFAKNALDFYDSDHSVSGISLFKYPAIEKRIHPFPFENIEDSSDVHFIQFASSWGQAWSYKQWSKFREWLKTAPTPVQLLGKVPFTVSDWPNKSWKKEFISYMVLQDTYFVYPNVSLSINFDDPGTNRFLETLHYQSKLKIDDRLFRFKSLQNSFNIYDAFFELKPETVKLKNSVLKNWDFELDLYGLKRPHEIKMPYVITSKKSKNPILTFGRKMKPHELNILFNVTGSGYCLTRIEDLYSYKTESKKKNMFTYREKGAESFVADFNFFYRMPLDKTEILKFIRFHFLKKWRRIFNLSSE